MIVDAVSRCTCKKIREKTRNKVVGPQAGPNFFSIAQDQPFSSHLLTNAGLKASILWKPSVKGELREG